ncbi:MAG TPA: hypothetical protein VHQ01_09215 [Pyrinomonadaceae bacterium]|nr:hypothetical protein [Pyrinomonadaceae bacterium]
MKICPRCQKTYTDDNLNFCLEDGSVLAQAAAPPPQTLHINDPQTIQMNDPRSTQQPSMPSQAGGQPGSQPGGQPGWNVAPQQYSMQPPKKSSKTWIWVLLILGLVVLLCGGGLVGFIFYAASQVDTAGNTISNSGKNTSTTSSNKSTSSTTNSSSSDRTDVDSVDLSEWVKENSLYGTTEFTNGEFIMGSKKKAFYYVLVAPESHKTEQANTRVTLRNIDDANSSLGYGLIFHSNPTPLLQDYALLIDTKRKKYHVVHHEPSKETSVVAWTNSDAIKGGTEENVLEARDLSDKIELYINGTMVTSIKNIYGYPGGVAGLYSGDGIKIAFKNLEIRK